MITKEELEKLAALYDDATKGDWYPVYTDDESFMNAVYVGTVNRGDRHDNQRGMEFNSCRDGEVVACTLLQAPGLINHESQKWDENAEFIAAVKNAFPKLLAAALKGLEDE